MMISPSFAILFAYPIVFVLHFIRRRKHPLFSKVFLILSYTTFLVLILFESVTILMFGKPICAEVLDAILTTNTTETGEFISAYLSQLPLPLAVFFIALIFGLFLRKGIQKYRVSCPIAFIFLIAMAPALESIAANVVQYKKIGKSKGFSASTSITRLAAAVVSLKKESEELIPFKVRSHPDTIQYISKEIQCSNIVVIIGESFSKYHSSLYSYPKVTNPKLGELAQSNLYVYNDVVTLFNYTVGVLKTIYGISGYGSNKTPPPPFPSILRGGGYKTHLLDQRDYLTQKRYQIIWKNMFDSKNETRFPDDMDLINTMDVSKAEPTLYVINLVGQHLAYANRYPESFARFQRNDYPEVSNSQHAEIIAHYDNATLYNDFVIYNVIQKLLDKEAVVLYFSDHGEEIYDYRNLKGHGTGLLEKGEHIKYQIEIPFMIWVSDLYKENHPDTVEKIKNAVDRPYNTGDLVHLIMDISGVKAEGYDPTKSVINDQFDSTHDRIVHRTINYDQLRREGRH